MMFLSLLVFLKYEALDFPACWRRKSESRFVQYRSARVERHQNQIIVNLKNCGLLRHEQRQNWDFGDDTSKSDGRIKEELVPVFPV